MFDESCGICRPLQPSQQQSCIVFWTIYPYCWSSLLPTSPPPPPLLLITEKVSNIIYKMKKRGQFTKSSSNDVAIYLVYKRKRKEIKTKNENKTQKNSDEHSCCLLFSPSLPYLQCFELWNFVK